MTPQDKLDAWQLVFLSALAGSANSVSSATHLIINASDIADKALKVIEKKEKEIIGT